MSNFVISFIHTIQVLLWTDCLIPHWLIYLEISGTIFFALIYFLIVVKKRKFTETTATMSKEMC